MTVNTRKTFVEMILRRREEGSTYREIDRELFPDYSGKTSRSYTLMVRTFGKELPKITPNVNSNS